MIDAIILVGFAGWFVATAVYQFGKTPVNRIEWYGFIPNCRFFCPNPIVTDVRAYYARSRSAQDIHQTLVWYPIVETNLPRTLPFWNPGHRLQKSVNILAPWLVQIREKFPATAHYTVPYLRLLNLASSTEEDSAESFTRFIVTRHRGRANFDRQILFESRVHAL